MRARDRGLRRVRGVSNWTAAAVIAATGATAGYFAHATAHSSASSPSSVTVQGAPQPCLTAPVATTGGSGVTVRPPAQACGSGANGSGAVSTYPAAGERERDS